MTHYTNTNNPVDFPKTKEKQMNERIKLLAEQCATPERFNVEKFAELIVAECLSFCEYEGDHLDEYDSGMTERARIIRESIQEHFGVEE